MITRYDANPSGQGRQRGAQIAPIQISPRIERITFLMERAIRIPGTNIRVGLDPILGFLLPEVGDVVGVVISAYLILASVRYGLPKGVIARMVFNLAFDYLVGSIPLVGDLFDFAWKANDKNLALLRRYARGEGSSFWSDWGWAIILLGLFGVMVAAIAGGLFYLLRRASLQMF